MSTDAPLVSVSMFLAKQRKLTLQQVGKLSARFKLPADVFIQSR
jgi:HTH-type transcriptional regulator/antitoxin HigA